MYSDKLKQSYYYLISLIILFSFSFSGCAAYKAISNYFNPTDHFLPFENDSRIMYEPGAEKFASAVSYELPYAVKAVAD